MREDRALWERVWGGASAFLARTRRLTWVDLAIAVSLAGLFYGLIDLANEWTSVGHRQVEIDASPWALPRYTFYSLTRGLIAYLFSLGFTLIYGYWAAKDRVAERLLIPILDILQSIPVLTFLPGLVIAFDAAFPKNNVGLEMACILMIFTGQAWNMTFSFYHSLRSVPADQKEVATVYRFGIWKTFKWVELPFSTMGLVWNSMMSMAGGWFFLTVVEGFNLGDREFQLPGLGSFIQVAVDNNRYGAMLWALLAMVLMIVGLDQLLWRPIVVWAQKFRVEEGGSQEQMTSWFLTLLRRSHILVVTSSLLRRFHERWIYRERKRHGIRAAVPMATTWGPRISLFAFTVVLAILSYGAYKLLLLLMPLRWLDWAESISAALATLARVLATMILGTLWALPAGLAIGLSPRLSRLLQPVVQVVASFPAPMLYPLVVVAFSMAGLSLAVGSVLLMLLGTQWYILFNVIAGAMAIPADLREAARSYRIVGWQRFRVLLFPGVFPALVTGWITAAGGAWNASIVTEYLKSKTEILKTIGLGARINEATEHKNWPVLAASSLIMAIIVVGFNRTLWRKLYTLAEERFALNK
jgi:NitT/TauT family transport system permease protein